MSKKSNIATVVVIFLILVVGVIIGFVLISTGPETIPEEKTSSAKIVQTIPLKPQSRSVSVSAFGSVISARKVEIKPQVSGRVVRQSDEITPGGHVRKGDELIRIDPQDYELKLAEVRASLEQARFERELESGRQIIAQREWNELQADLNMQEVNRSLVLREPHLRRAEALMEKARNDIEKAELDIARTVIEAPFNAMVVEESVETGQLLSPNSTICELVGTDEFWIQVTLPFSQLKWVQFPDGETEGALVDVVLDTGNGRPAVWPGHVVRLLSDLDPLGRMARLIVSVSDPLGLETKEENYFPLLLGSYVEVRIDAGMLQNGLRIPRESLREGNIIWVVGSDGLLKVLSAEILWSEKETLIIESAIEEGDQLIVSDLRVALPGMEVVPQVSSAYPDLLDELNQ